MSKHFIDKFQDTSAWVVIDQDNQIDGKALMKWSKAGHPTVSMVSNAMMCNFSTTGTSTGYGYDKASAAFEDLFLKLGYTNMNCGGRGMSVVEEYLYAKHGLRLVQII